MHTILNQESSDAHSGFAMIGCGDFACWSVVRAT